MNNRVNYFLIGSYVGLIIAAVGGFVLMPELFFTYPHSGISLWGNYFPSVIPFAFGLATSIICLIYAARFMPSYPERLNAMRRLLLSIAIGLAIILLTPGQANLMLYWAHTFAAIYLFLVAGGGAAWAMLHAGQTRLDWFLLGMLIAGSMLALLSASYVRLLGYLTIGQLLALNGAALIIIRNARRWVAQEVEVKE